MTELPHRPRLKPTVDVFPAPDGDIHLYRGGDADFVIEGGSASTLALLKSLDGARTATADEDFGYTRAEARASIAQLVQLGLVEDAAADEALCSYDRERYDRQLRYLGDLAPVGASRAEYQLKLRQSSIAVLGVGGLGGATALALAAIGIGRLVLVDGDAVELSNLNRQVLFGEADIGRRKVEVAVERLRSFNSGVEIEAQDRCLTGAAEIRSIAEDVDFVVDAVDTPAHAIESWVNQGCFSAGTAYIGMSQFPPSVRIGPLFVPGVTGCYACQEASWRARYPLFGALAEHRQQHPSPAPALGPTSLLIGGHVAADVMHYLTGLRAPASLGQSVVIDVVSMQVELIPVVQIAHCEICARAARGNRSPA